ncbi:MAG TPA: aminoglycoside adenylyltransferase [Clostridiaceae bacterium]|nr:aminoglycoside adenylyltransferase [Clostridiaceae bacterium]
MRSEKEMFDLILDTARDDDRIRAVYMNGSRTNPNAPRDIFQDYDIVYLVTETNSFIQDKNWIDIFGERLILQLPDELDKIAGKETHFESCYVYLMQFADGNRIDLSIRTLDSAMKDIKSDKLTVILLDKDGVLPEIPKPTDEDYHVKKPTQELFYRACNEFWWVILYIAKGLWRREIPYAMDCWNFWVRPQLVKMLSWYAGMLTGFSFSVGKSGKYLNRYLPDDIWRKFLQTYSNADIVSMWKSVFVMGELFERTARSVAEEFGFSYDFEQSQRILSYLKHISKLPKDAKEII